ncbi:hypothetical protein HSBAA_27970 [Vreelandella sulfidaeris]|uniref:Uncharacterized protein n=1 Tax=Vreelandella sulfidaeris TaxID=115553 RepID=A0A455UA97_9GAMM|nr:hypothetical protein HSBAA_27970 [Halomonas sulfidaeris]
MHKFLTFCWLGIMTTVAANAYAEEEDSDLPDWAEERIEPFRESVGNWVDNTSRRIDGFFGTDDHMQAKNESYLRFGQEIDWMEEMVPAVIQRFVIVLICPPPKSAYVWS